MAYHWVSYCLYCIWPVLRSLKCSYWQCVKYEHYKERKHVKTIICFILLLQSCLSKCLSLKWKWYSLPRLNEYLKSFAAFRMLCKMQNTYVLDLHLITPSSVPSTPHPVMKLKEMGFWMCAIWRIPFGKEARNVTPWATLLVLRKTLNPRKSFS